MSAVSGPGKGFCNPAPTSGNSVKQSASGDWPRACFVGTGGNVTLIAPDDSEGVFTNLADGTMIDCSFKAIKAGATASNFVGIY